MSKQHPIISVTGASGARRGTVKQAFGKVLRREGLRACFVDGDSFHRYDRAEMREAEARAAEAKDYGFSHFGPEANRFEDLENLFATFGEHGTGKTRRYLHSAEEAVEFAHLGLKPGQFTPWEDIAADTDVLVYEGLHGCVRAGEIDVGRFVDLRIGVAPVINLEWIQKIHRDTSTRGYSEEAVMDTILRRMPDYVRYIVPQFKHSDINFQRVPVVDTSDPIIARDVPDDDESMLVIRFRRPEDFDVDFPYLLRELQDSYMSRRNTIVVPGGKMGLAMELVLPPVVRRLMERRQAA